SAYWIVSEPTRGTKWKNGAVNLIQWEKGRLDGVEFFDIEMARLNDNGLTLIARGVPAKQTSLNVMLQDVPPGDDYFILFINATHGVMHGTSERFTILSTSDSSSSSVTTPAPDKSSPTITISGAPDPTKPFATTLAVQNAAALAWNMLPIPISLVSLMAVVATTWMSALWTLL
ncbi:hypothetical protein AMATHDRAFT_150478, partial [Amanita thiersii Skay4041]